MQLLKCHRFRKSVLKSNGSSVGTLSLLFVPPAKGGGMEIFMKEAIIISCFDNYSYPVRVKHIEKYIKDNGYNCSIIAADFDHRNKKEYNNKREGLLLLHVPTYKKNMSFARINSHRVFAKNVKQYLEQHQPQLIFVCTPPNFLFHYVRQYKVKHPESKVVYQIGDMWPETLPVSKKTKKLLSPILWIWSSLRNKNLRFCDGIIYECNLFKDYLKPYSKSVPEKTIYLCKANKDYRIEERELSFPMNILYLGSINNIIDCELIVDFLFALNKKIKCKLVIIGDGENRAKLVDLCFDKGIEVEFNGIVYDEIKKQKIIERCHFALNVMKETVFVGATMKSIDYFYYGLPVINNISGDSVKLIDQYSCGINLDRNDIEKAVSSVVRIDNEMWKKMRLSSRQLYMECFETSRMIYNIDLFLKNIM